MNAVSPAEVPAGTAGGAVPLLVTQGDPVGIGPECIVRAFVRGRLGGAVVVGDIGVMRRAAAVAGLRLPVARLDSPRDLPGVPPGCLPVVEPAGLPAGLAALPWGRVDARAGAAAVRCIEEAVAAVRRGDACALVTAPIHKAAWAAAGIAFPGHTELLQSLCTEQGRMPPVRMMLANDELRVVLVTIHQSLRAAIDALSFDAVLHTLRVADAALRGMHLKRPPRIAVAGLNPHAGEDGLFGDEEIRIIAPAIEAARREGIDAHGPFAPDTVFMRARDTAQHPGEFDLVVAMTHDHGLIPVKYLGIDSGVNVTLGLPLIRTSPDHGTAFDIAGRGLADPRSLEAAVRHARAAVLSSSRPATG